MLSKRYKYLTSVFIGRFQPFHKGHLHSIQFALQNSKNLVIVLGGYRMAPSVREPWSAEERIEMIKAALPATQSKRISFVCIRNRYYVEDIWKNNVRYEVMKSLKKNGSVALVGHEKDASSYYLKIFHEWNFIETGNYKGIDGTRFRKDFFIESSPSLTKDIPPNVAKWLKKYRTTDAFKMMQKEFIAQEKNNKIYYQYKVTNFSYAFVMCGRYILLEKRNDFPGKGLYSLLSNGLNKWLSLEHYKHSNKNFTHPLTNPLEKIISEVSYYKIEENNFFKIQELYKIKKTMEWVMIDDLYLNEDKIYADHFQIIQWFLRY